MDEQIVLMFICTIIMLLIGEVVYFVYHFLNKRNMERATFQKWEDGEAATFSKDELNFIKKEAKRLYGGFQIDDITWHDLDMDEVYQTMNLCLSSAGDRTLYGMLRNPLFDKEKIAQRYQMQEWLLHHDEEQKQLRSILFRVGGQCEVAIDALYTMNEAYTLVPTGFALCLGLGLLIGILACVLGYLTLLPIVIALVIGNYALVASYHKKRAHAYTCAMHLYRYVQAMHVLGKMSFDPVFEETYQIKKCAKELTGIHHSMFPDMLSADGLILLFTSTIFMGELISYGRLREQLFKHRHAVMEAVRIIGELEALFVAGVYQQRQPIHCAAMFTEEKKIIAKTMVHPLLKQPVPNDVDFTTHILISGSNASGKSTYLKMIAINAIFAQSFGFALAKQYEAGMFLICTSMALKDSLEEKDSYFVAEVRSIKRILEQLNEERPVLCMIDEILRGTNTGERIAAASEILMTFTNTPSLCIAATHDLELTHILQHHYRNMHFQEQLQEEKMAFDYQLKEGASNSRNAIRLLETLGFPRNAIEEAKRLRDGYEQYGRWMKVNSEVGTYE